MSNELKVFQNSEFGQLELYVDGNGKEWFPATDIAKVLGYKDPYDTIKKHCKGDGITHYKVHTNGGLQNKKFINKSNIMILVENSRLLTSDQKVKILKSIGMETYNFILSHKETEYISIIKNAFRHIKSIQQFRVGSYKIDIYFPTIKLSVECDENGHIGRNKKYETEREEYIKNKTNCHVIRFNPDKKNFNIGNIINEILIYINEIQLNNKNIS